MGCKAEGRGKWLAIIFLLTIQLYAKETPKDSNVSVDQNATIQLKENQTAAKTIIGGREMVRVIPGNVILKARIDTGATTTSLGVDSYEIINEDGKEWAEVVLNGVKSKHKVVDYVFIKQHNDAEALKRPVIQMRLILGDVSESIKVTLADRSNFTYKVLIGRNFLYDHFIVDVSLKYTTTPILYEEK